MKSLIRLAVCLFALSVLASASDRCSGGSGGGTFRLWDDYLITIGPSGGDHAGQCHVSIHTQDGKVFWENDSFDVQAHEYSGKDVNNDGKPDVIVFGHVNKGDRQWMYWIVEPPAGLQRQISTVFPLTFEDRDGDGKMEIWTREWSYDGIDGLNADDSPHPLVAFRLNGTRLSYISNLFPQEYEAEVAQSRQHITDEGITALKNEESQGMTVQKEKAGAKDKDDPKTNALALDAKIGVLGVVTSYLYAGKGAEAWKELQNWGYNDRDRIRQVILRLRQNGIMRQLNAPQPGVAAQTAQAPSPTSQPQ